MTQYSLDGRRFFDHRNHFHPRRLVEELLRLDPGLAARVAERTDGNPLFAVQRVGDWVERGVLVPTARGLALDAGEDGPPRIEAGPPAQRLLAPQRRWARRSEASWPPRLIGLRS